MQTSGPVTRNLKLLFRYLNRRHLIHIFALICLTPILWIELGMVQVHATSFDHTVATIDSSCTQAHLSPDGNPFPL